MEEVFGAMFWFSYFAGLEIKPEVLQDDDQKKIQVVHKPLGVVASITPWNFPIILLAFKFGPALLAGNTIVAKPSEYTPLSSLLVGQILKDVLPAGVVNFVSGPGSVGAELASRFPFLDSNKKLILVTGHRRENFDGGIERICTALTVLATRGDVQIVYPVHPNPNVRSVVNAALGGVPNIHLIEPQDYLPPPRWLAVPLEYSSRPGLATSFPPSSGGCQCRSRLICRSIDGLFSLRSRSHSSRRSCAASRRRDARRALP